MAYLDLTGLSLYDAKIKTYIATNGGKIDKITVNGTALGIASKSVALPIASDSLCGLMSSANYTYLNTTLPGVLSSMSANIANATTIAMGKSSSDTYDSVISLLTFLVTKDDVTLTFNDGRTYLTIPKNTTINASYLSAHDLNTGISHIASIYVDIAASLYANGTNIYVINLSEPDFWAYYDTTDNTQYFYALETNKVDLSGYSLTSHTHSFANITSKPTNISGYGITDCKIASGVITIGSNTITPLTSHQSLSSYATIASLGSWAKTTNASTARTNLGLGSAAMYNVTTEVTASSGSLITSGAIASALNSYITSTTLSNTLAGYATTASLGSWAKTTVAATARSNLGLGTACTYSVTTSLTSGSSALLTSGGAYTALSGKQDSMSAITEAQINALFA